MQKEDINLNKFTSEFSAYKQYNSGIGYKELFNEELVNELKNLYPVTANVDVKVVEGRQNPVRCFVAL